MTKAENGSNNWQNSVGHYTFGPANGVNIPPGHFNIGGSPWQPSVSPNFNYTTVTTTEPEQTSLEVFEELVGLIKLVELKLNLDPKDDSKHKWLEMIMGRIQEETINDTLQRLKALKL